LQALQREAIRYRSQSPQAKVTLEENRTETYGCLLVVVIDAAM